MGTNFRMTDVEAAIGLVQLGRLPEYTAARRSNAAALDAGLSDVPGVTVPYVEPHVEHSYHQYTILLEPEVVGSGRDEFVEKLNQAGIGAASGYHTSLNRQPVFVDMLGESSIPGAEWATERCVALPVHPFLSPEDIESIVAGVRRAAGA